MFIFRKIWRALFLQTHVLRLALLLYYRQNKTFESVRKVIPEENCQDKKR